jgi:hypothetical protein
MLDTSVASPSSARAYAGNVIAIDPGSSYTKVSFADGSVHQFPSIITKLAPADITAHIAKFVIWYDGVPYLCGYDALAQSDLKQERDVRADAGFHGSIEQEVLFAYIFDELELSGRYNTLCQSLPFVDHLEDSLVSRICAKKEISWKRAEKTKSLQFDVREIVAQGVGALALKNYLNNPEFRTLIVVDGGSVTLDVPVLTWHIGKQQHVYSAQSFSSRTLNVRELINQIKSELRSLPGLQDRNWGYHDLAEMHRERRYSIQHGSHKYEPDRILPIFQSHMKKFTIDLNKYLKEQLGDEMWSRADRVLIAGGIVHWLDKSVWTCNERTEFLDETANAKGQLASYQSMGASNA